jgi:hypothetical protein
VTLSKSSSGPLHLVLQPTAEEVFEPDSASELPLVRFIAYGDHHQVFGWVRLQADRLTDLLNAHAELHLADVEIESFVDGIQRSFEEVVIQRGELVAVHATGPRGDSSRREERQAHPLVVQAGNYVIWGQLHADPGADPIASLRDRGAMLPLTDAWIEYWSGGARRYRSGGTIIVNREKADWIRLASPEDRAGIR